MSPTPSCLLSRRRRLQSGKSDGCARKLNLSPAVFGNGTRQSNLLSPISRSAKHSHAGRAISHRRFVARNSLEHPPFVDTVSGEDSRSIPAPALNRKIFQCMRWANTAASLHLFPKLVPPSHRRRLPDANRTSRPRRTFRGFRFPSDELFQLWLSNATTICACAVTPACAGEKVKPPLGRKLHRCKNWELDKIVYSQGAFLTVKAGPILDSGQIYHPSAIFRDAQMAMGHWSSNQDCSDTSGQLRIRLQHTEKISAPAQISLSPPYPLRNRALVVSFEQGSQSAVASHFRVREKCRARMYFDHFLVLWKLRYTLLGTTVE